MIKTILLVVAAVVVLGVVGLLVFAATRADTFRIQRSIAIKAPPEKIAALIEDFRRWPGWSPYEKLDPDMKRILGGAASGKGATYAWDGNNKTGAGQMEILETSPTRILIKLDFLRPFQAHNTAEFTLQPKGDTTEVTWAMYGPNLFISKVMQAFLNIDRMVGGDFETGLAALKTAAEQ